MYFNRQALGELKEVIFQKPRIRRLIATAWIAPTFLSVRKAAAGLCALDDKLYPAYRSQKIDRPVFIFANPRSGTTLTHRLMSLDDDVFTTVKLYQTILPSVTATKLFEKLISMSDKRFGGGLKRIYDFFNAPLAKRWHGVHELGLDQTEEDECIFLFALQSPTMGLLFPFIDDLREQFWLDAWDDQDRREFMDFYEGILKRHVYAAGAKRFLNKNVFFAPRVKSMYERFPDAVFVYLVRNPYDSLPSFLNLYYRAWTAVSPDTSPDGEEINALKRLGYDYYRYALDCQREIPAEQFITIRYEDLVADPKETILGLYGRLGMPASEAFERRLDEAMIAHREWNNPRDYTLEFFGLTCEEIYDELRGVFERFGYEKQPDVCVEAAQ